MILEIYSAIFLLGAMIGSFLNVVICRLPKKESIVVVGSHCPKCAKKLCWFDLIPILSFFVIRGKCRNCKEKISWQYPLVEFACGALFVGLALVHGYDSIYFLRDAVFACFLILIFALDAKHYLVFDEVVLPGIAVGVLANLAIAWQSGSLLVGFLNLVTAIFVCGLFFLLQYLISGGRWIGSGDIFIGVMLGAMLGWPLVGVAVFLSYIIGAIVALVLLIQKKKKRGDQLPLGVFLCLGTFVALLWGNDLLTWYLNRIGF